MQAVPFVNNHPGPDTYSGPVIPEMAKFAAGGDGVTPEVWLRLA